jgi:hypothetical protein
MVDPAQVLSALRPLHHAAAPGDLLSSMAAMSLLGCAAAVSLSYFSRPWLMRRHALRRSALNDLAAARRLPPNERIAAQAAILRRVVAALDGSAAGRQRESLWLARLDLIFSTQFFSAGEGRAFGDALYQPMTNADVKALDKALADFFARIDR